jgi:type II secretory pathway component GspD/PulD (secretin)
MHLRHNQLVQTVQNPNASPNQFCSWYLINHIMTLNGQTRIALVNEQAAGNLQDSPVSSFQILFQSDPIRKHVRKIVHDAFGQYLVIDPTNLGRLSLRLSDREPLSDLEERGIHAEAVKFHAAAFPIVALVTASKLL